MKKNIIYHADSLDKLKEFEDNVFDSIVTDPPYGFKFMGKEWDYDVPSVELWKECLRVLKPGGHLLSFSGARTYHRMAVNIEDAGFEIRDQIMWLYGSGFPKSMNIGKAIDKHSGNIKITKGNTEWEGWGTGLKPAHEPIVVARKPISENSIAENVLKWRTGGINIDECRIPLNGENNPTGSAKRVYASNQYTDGKVYGENKETPYNGRFPANVIHDGSDVIVNQFPNTKSGFMKTGTNRLMSDSENKNCYGRWNPDKTLNDTFGDEGSASRFFYCAKVDNEERNIGLDDITQRQSSHNYDSMKKSEEDDGINYSKRNHHPTVKPIALMEYLVKLVTPKNGIVLDPFFGSGSTGCACMKNGFNFIGIEREEEYIHIAEKRVEHFRKKGYDKSLEAFGL